MQEVIVKSEMKSIIQHGYHETALGICVGSLNRWSGAGLLEEAMFSWPINGLSKVLV